MTKAPPELLSAKETAAALSISRTTLWRWTRLGVVRAVKRGARVLRYQRSEIELLAGRSLAA